MLIEYLYSIFFQILIFASIIGYGFLLQDKILRVKLSNFSFFLILGIIFISFLTTFYHLFYPVSKNYNIIIHLLGLVLFFLFFENYKKYFYDKYLYIILIISLIVGFGYKPNEDYLTYHLPYIINFTSDKAIFGLANIQANQGWNSMWLNFSSTFFLPITGYKTVSLANVILFKIILIFFYQTIFKNKNQNNILLYLSFLFLTYFLIKFSRLNSFGIDVPSNYLVLISIMLMLKINKKNTKIENENTFLIALILGSFATLIKISNALIIIILIVIILKKKFNIFSRTSVFITLFFLIYFAQQIIYSGCFFFPIKFTCIEIFDWTSIDYARTFSEGTNHDNKSYSSYTGSLSPQEYVKNYNWVNTWIKRNGIELFEHLIILMISMLLIFFINKDRMFQKNKNNKSINFILYTVLGFSLISTIYWFHSQPVIRYGIVNLFIFLSLFAYILIFKNYNLENKLNSLKKIFLIALAFLIIKNFLKIKENNFLAFYPIKKFTFNKNKVLGETNIFISEENWCGNIPHLCITKDSNLEIKKNNFNYLVVKKKNSKSF